MKSKHSKQKGMPLPHFVMPDAPFGNTHYNMAVWGSCGAGKTALVMPILRRLSEQTEPVTPVDDALLAAIAANMACTITLPKATPHNTTQEA